MPGDILKFLVLVTVIGGGVVAGAIFLVGDDGGGTSVCDQPLAPVTDGEISQVAFQEEDAGLGRVIEAASEGDLEAAEKAFFGDVQDFIRSMDRPLRDVEEGVAKDLCEAVTELEKEFVAAEPKADSIAARATHIRELLWDAAETLGYARPSE